MIGSKTYHLKSTVDRALSSLCLRLKPRLGSRCCSSKSLNHLSDTLAVAAPTLGLQRSISSGEYSLGEDEESYPVKKSKPPFIVLMSSRSEDQSDDVPWNAECDFKLEEVWLCPSDWSYRSPHVLDWKCLLESWSPLVCTGLNIKNRSRCDRQRVLSLHMQAGMLESYNYYH